MSTIPLDSQTPSTSTISGENYGSEHEIRSELTPTGRPRAQLRPQGPTQIPVPREQAYRQGATPSNAQETTSASPLELDYASLAILDQVVDESWQPPIPWSNLDLTLDQQKWIVALATLGLRSKASGATVCKHFWRRMLQYISHFTRVGLTTCHLFTCRNCGTGKMRVHRIAMQTPSKFKWMTEQKGSTIRIAIRYAQPALDLESYLARVDKDKRTKLVSFKRHLKKAFGKEFGYQMSIELDPKMKDVAFRLFYVGPELGPGWARRHWQRIVGVQAYTEYRSHSRDGAKDALRWTMDSLTGVLLLEGKERADWEKAFDGCRLTAAVGTLRGIADPENTKSDKGDDPAPNGYCPCGCGGIVEKVTDHSPMSTSDLYNQYKIVQFGPLSTYIPYRSKVNGSRSQQREFATLTTKNSRAAPS